MFTNDRDDRWHTQWPRWLTIVILLGAAGWQCIGAWTDSQTTDEAVHLVAGYSYLRTNDHRLNPEHPPLVKLLAAAPLLGVKDLAFTPRGEAWDNAEQWGIGSRLLYRSRPDPRAAQWILLLGRIPVILMTGALIWLVGWWAKKHWGAWAGVLAAGLLAFDPTILGHGHLVTTDVPLGLAFMATIILLERFLERPTWQRLWPVAIVFALAQVTKFSAIILWILIPLILLIHASLQSDRTRWTWALRLIGALLVITPLIVWPIYGFEVQRFDTDPRVRATLDAALRGESPNASESPILTSLLGNLAQPDSVFGSTIQNLRGLPIPAYSYFRGLVETANHNSWGHTAFFLGEVREFGWVQYFPVAVAMKLPAITWLALAIGIFFAIRQVFQKRSNGTVSTRFLVIVVPPLLYLAWSMTSHINIGVRHALPFMVFLPLWAASTVTTPFLRPIRRQALVVLCFVLILIGTSLAAWPHTIGYFNWFVGGTRNAPNLIHDSNFDWNQDTYRLRDYLDRQRITDFAAAIPGGRTELFFSGARRVPTDPEIDAGNSWRGPLFITAAVLFDRDNPFRWLWNRTPTTIIGTGIYRFDET